MQKKNKLRRPTLTDEPVINIPGLPEIKTDRAILSVSQLTGLIKGSLETGFYDLWVEGEVSNSKQAQSGHIYFSLKDNQSVLNCVLFKQSLTKIKFQIEDGLQLILHGRISVYELRGQYQFIVDQAEVSGLGSLQQAFEQLKNKLFNEGLFDESRKRDIPMLPQRIGIVTSPTGAAIRDILKVLDRRFANLEIIISPAPVQGSQAAPLIVEALNNLYRLKNLDVIIIARGGGSLEDLWPFNEEQVARAVYLSPIPVISAIGHEIDYTICDFVADLRAPTPSAAAELVVTNKLDLEEKLDHLSNSLIQDIRDLVESQKDKLQDLRQSMALTQPDKILVNYYQVLDDHIERLQREMGHLLEIQSSDMNHLHHRLESNSPRQKLNRWMDKLSHLETRLTGRVKQDIQYSQHKFHTQFEKLNTLGPLAVLGRGYSITFLLPEKSILTDVNQVSIDNRVEVRLHQGRFKANVYEKEQ